jgi:hypothetical protein
MSDMRPGVVRQTHRSAEERRSVGKARCLAKIGVAGELLQHEVGSIRARDFRQEKPVADVGAGAIDALSRTIGQRRGAGDDPIERAFPDDGFLHGLIRE